MPIPTARLPTHDEVLRTRVAVNDHRPGHAVVDLPDGSGARRVDGQDGTGAGIRIGGVSKFAVAAGEASTVVLEGETPVVVSTLNGKAGLQVDDPLKVEADGTFGFVDASTVGGFVVALAREVLDAEALDAALAAGSQGVVIVARLVPRGEFRQRRWMMAFTRRFLGTPRRDPAAGGGRRCCGGPGVARTSTPRIPRCGQPPHLRPKVGTSNHCILTCRDTDAELVGEATNPAFSQGKRRRVALIDEAARVPHNVFASTWLALESAAHSIWLVYNPGGRAHLTYQLHKGESPVDPRCVFEIDWTADPRRDEDWKASKIARRGGRWGRSSLL